MIKIIPSITIKGGQVVKTIKGDIDQVKVYDNNPIDIAQEYEAQGIDRLHLIDLDGANQGKIVNYNTLETLAKYTKMDIDFTGGVATEEDVRVAFESGAKFITAATIPVHEKEKFNSWLISYGNNKIILAADSLDRVVLTKGWKRHTGINLFEHLDYYYQRGVTQVKCTEIARDGTLMGPAFELYEEIIQKFPEIQLLATGGVRSTEDIARLEEIGVTGVIIGKSLYEGKIKIQDLSQFTQA